ncbi:MAG: hypothetical protein Q4F77_12740 [Acinetobacter sp.]|uniref:hypothetical protein n=1 Tax=Acinetobacter sp. TaxID=472 RepID=UPI0026DEB4A8|nr:hypothetical protein [Acinetobacter sp.]MDO5544148.1 hypothetical protein [Acinetobacter sp.]
MKKLLLLSLLSALAVNASAASNCSITYIAGDKLTYIIKQNPFDFENYDQVCNRLKNANARVSLSFNSSIGERQTIAVVMATVLDKNLPITSHITSSSIWTSATRTTAMESELLMDAINGSLNLINQSDIDSLNESRKKLGVKTYPASNNVSKK